MKDVHSEYIYHAMIKKENKGYHEKETNLIQCIVCFLWCTQDLHWKI